MTIKRILGLVFLIALLSFFIINYYPKTSNFGSSETIIKSNVSDQNKEINFKEFNESDFDFFVYRAHVLSSENNANKLKEKIVIGGYPAFVETFGDKDNLFAVYVGPFLSEDDIVNNMDSIQLLSESSNGEISRWKL